MRLSDTSNFPPARIKYYAMQETNNRNEKTYAFWLLPRWRGGKRLTLEWLTLGWLKMADLRMADLRVA